MFTSLLHHLVSPTMLMSSPLPRHIHTLTGEQGFCSQDQNFTAESGGLSWLRETARHSHCRAQTKGKNASPLHMCICNNFFHFPSFSLSFYPSPLLSLLLHPSPSLLLTHSQEAGSINKSLSALGNVIMALVDITHGKSRHVHYRDSKLTFLLRVCHVVHLPTQSMSFHTLLVLALFQAISPNLSLYGGGNNKACSLHHVVQSSATTRVSNLLCMLWLWVFPLQDSLGGNAKTNLVANVHPSGRYIQHCLVSVSYLNHTLNHKIAHIVPLVM